MEQLNAYDSHQNVTETQATEYHRKYGGIHKVWIRPIYDT